MGNILSSIEPIVKIEPKWIAEAIIKVRRLMDQVDSGKDLLTSQRLSPEVPEHLLGYVWMLAALVLAHEALFTSDELRKVQYSIHKADTDVLFT